MGSRVSDAVWQRLDPNAGRLTRRATWRMWAWLLPAVLVAVGAVMAVAGGLVVPQLAWYRTDESWLAVTPDRQVRLTLMVTNMGQFPVTIVDVYPDSLGVRALPAAGEVLGRLGPHQGRSVVMVAQVTDCGAIPDGDWTFRAVLDRPWPRSVPIAAFVPAPSGVWQPVHSACAP